MSEPVYLDHNASTPLLPEVIDVVARAMRDGFANPSSAHVYGQRARAFVEDARAAVAALLGCAADEIVFTSGGTEANNLAIHGALPTGTAGGAIVTSTIVTTTIEHPATARMCTQLAQLGHEVVRVAVDEHGVLRLDEMARALDALRAPASALVTLIHAHNETGVIQPVAAVARLARARGARVHTDGAQSVGKIPVDVGALDVDLLSLAGHKLGAPKGVGALYVRRGVALEPLLRGAGHESGRRPGTENVAAIAGLGVACAVARRTLDSEMVRQRELCARLLAQLVAGVPALVRTGGEGPRLPNTLHVRFPAARAGVGGSALLAACPEVAAATGSACHDGHEEASASIVAMGVPVAEALRSVRLTLGRTSTLDDVERAATALVLAWRRVSL